MSFVGTRPEVTKYVKKYTKEMRATLLLPAGITSEASIQYKDEAELGFNIDIRICDRVTYTSLSCQIYHNCRFIICEDLIDQCFICDRAFNKVPGRV